MVSGLLPSFVSKVSLELCLTELCQLPDVLYSQDICDGSAKFASQVTATAEKEKEKSQLKHHVDTMPSLLAAAVPRSGQLEAVRN